MRYSVERFKKRGLKYSPDLVIYLINEWNLNKFNEVKIPIKDKLVNAGIPDNDLNQPVYRAGSMADKEVIESIGLEKIKNYQSKQLYKLAEFYKNKLLILTFPYTPVKYKEIIIDDLVMDTYKKKVWGSREQRYNEHRKIRYHIH